MRSTYTRTPPLKRPACTSCNSFMRLTLIEPHFSGRHKDYFAYACLDCHQTLELAIDSIERFALHASAVAP